MAENTGISWTDSTFNPWIGCAKVSPGCDHCYAEVSTPSRTQSIIWGPNETRKQTGASNWKLPLRWNVRHDEFFAQHGRRRRVFCASLADVFDNKADPAWREKLWALIRETPNLDWLILTKRVGNVMGMLPADWRDGYANVWLGISVVNQEEADRDIGKLVAVPAKTRFLSMEPLLGPITFGFEKTDCVNGCGSVNPVLCNNDKDLGCPKCGSYTTSCSAARPNPLRGVHWVIVGGESGPHARPMDGAWVESLRTQCGKFNVAFFFKQWGGTAKDKGGCELASGESKEWPLSALAA
jgi:protein gp37